jgi:hypothetical protein
LVAAAILFGLNVQQRCRAWWLNRLAIQQERESSGEKQNLPVFQAFNYCLLILSGSLFAAHCLSTAYEGEDGEISGWVHLTFSLFFDTARYS